MSIARNVKSSTREKRRTCIRKNVLRNVFNVINVSAHTKEQKN